MQRRDYGYKALLLFVICFGVILVKKIHTEKPSITMTRTVTVYDTVKVLQPVVRDSVVTRYETCRLPVVEKDTFFRENHAQKVAEIIPDASTDSIDVRVPITQKMYKDSLYTAWVSGYEPKLDSIYVFNKNVSEKITVKEKAKRLGVGIIGGVGYGMTSKKPDVFIGIGVYYLVRR